jgi:ribosome-associated toxin RatA of RatAB toxin-antitoxin module
VQEADISAPAPSVWETVSDFNGWGKFFSLIENSHMSGQGLGSVRFLKLQGETELVVERQDASDAKTRTLAYTILTSPLPVEDYHARMEVTAITGEIAHVRWSAQFLPKGATPEVARQTIENVFVSGLAGLKTLFTPKVVEQKFIPAAPAEIWKVVGNFNGLSAFVPSVISSQIVTSGPNTFRILKIQDDSTIVIERLDDWDPEQTTLTYYIVGSPFAFENCAATIQISPQAQGSLVTWSGRYLPIGDPAIAEQFLRGVYTGGLDTLYGLFAPAP